jgi:hypothetical protein
MNGEDESEHEYLLFDCFSCRIDSSSLATRDDEGKHRKLDDVQFHDSKVVDMELDNEIFRSFICATLATLNK